MNSAASGRKFLDEQQSEGQRVCVCVTKGGRKGTGDMELRGLNCLFPGANANTFSNAIGQTEIWSNVTRNGSCQRAYAICLQEVVPYHTVPRPETEVQQRSASVQGAPAHAHTHMGQPPRPEYLAGWTRAPGLVALILA